MRLTLSTNKSLHSLSHGIFTFAKPMLANATLMYLVEFLPQVQDRRQLGGPLFLVKLARLKIGSHQNFELANHLTTDKITAH